MCKAWWFVVFCYLLGPTTVCTRVLTEKNTPRYHDLRTTRLESCATLVRQAWALKILLSKSSPMKAGVSRIMENAVCMPKFNKTRVAANSVSMMPTSIKPARRGMLHALSSKETSVNSWTLAILKPSGSMTADARKTRVTAVQALPARIGAPAGSPTGSRPVLHAIRAHAVLMDLKHLQAMNAYASSMLVVVG